MTGDAPRRRASAIRAFLAFLPVLFAPPLAVAQAEHVWEGEIRCGPIPDVATLPLRQHLTLRVVGNVASYQRVVRRGDTRVATPYTEEGSGTVGPDGAITLTATVQARTFSYEARYAGRLPPGGGHAHLTGAQIWTAVNGPSGYRRPCGIDLDG